MLEQSQRYRAMIEEMVGPDRLREFNTRSFGRTLLTFGHIWLSLAASFLLIYVLQQVALPAQIVVGPILIFFVGTRINAFAVQIHEASHGCLMRDRSFNDLYCNVFGAYWILNDVRSYWIVHREHHIHLHEETDPDRVLYGLQSENAKQVMLVLLQDFFFVTALKRIYQYVTRPRPKAGQMKSAVARLHLAAKLVCQGLLLTLFVTTFGTANGVVLFAIYWVVPLFCVFPVLIRIRIVTEHFSEHLFNARVQPFVSRTTVTQFIESYFIGAQMEYHMEHHLYPNFPYYQLKRLHRELEGKGMFAKFHGAELENLMSGGYFRFWKHLLWDADLSSRRDKAVVSE